MFFIFLFNNFQPKYAGDLHLQQDVVVARAPPSGDGPLPSLPHRHHRRQVGFHHRPRLRAGGQAQGAERHGKRLFIFMN